MQNMIVFSVQYNTDKVEGRGRQIDTGIYFTKQKDAEEFECSQRYKKYACMGIVGNTSYNVKEKVINVFDSLEDFDNSDFSLVEERDKALSKLTQREREVLGLS